MSESAPLVGIDIGGTRVKAAINGPDGWSVGTSDEYVRPPKDVLLASIRSALSAAGHAWGKPSCVGLCVPGIPSEDDSRIEIAVNVPGLIGWAFEDLVQEAIGADPIRINRAGDAEAATTDWAEAHRASGRVLGLAIGTGVGLAVLDDGRPLRVTDGGAGHIGQIDVGADSASVGPDGGRGGLEAYIGARAVREAGGLNEAFGEGTPGLIALVRAIRTCHAIYRPDAIVLLGGIGHRLAGNPFIESNVREKLTRIAREGWILAFGDDDHHAARGVARLAAQTPTDR